jgi:hypothetical protein
VNPTVKKFPIAKPTNIYGKRSSEQKGRYDNIDKKEI